MSIKSLHRDIMLSAVYQLGSEYNEADYAKDSGNQYYWRMNRKRLDAEQIRDSLLEISNSLEPKLYGPSEELTPQLKRRTIYGKVSRYKLDTYLALFDFPSPSVSAEQRFSTNVPLQRLFFMNSDFVQQESELLAQRVASEPTQTARINKAYQLVFGRLPSSEELALGLEYLRSEPMREYEEFQAKQKADKPKDEKQPGSLVTQAPDGAVTVSSGHSDQGKKDADKPAPSTADPAAAAAAGGMMAGVMGPSKDEEAKKLLPVTPWGRYAKALLSSSEFYYVN